MAVAALALFVVFTLVVIVVRTLIQLRLTGDTGHRRFGVGRGLLEWCADLLFGAGAVAVGVAAPIADLAGAAAIEPLDRPAVRGGGAVFAGVCILATFAAQVVMGPSWRIGVDQGEHTALVTTGPFRLVRNPVYTASVAGLAGLALMVPNLIAVAGLAVVVVGAQLQVRLVEEPYLRRVHGRAYQEYAARVGRFVPGLGRDPSQ